MESEAGSEIMEKVLSIPSRSYRSGTDADKESLWGRPKNGRQLGESDGSVFILELFIHRGADRSWWNWSVDFKLSLRKNIRKNTVVWGKELQLFIWITPQLFAEETTWLFRPQSCLYIAAKSGEGIGFCNCGWFMIICWYGDSIHILSILRDLPTPYCCWKHSYSAWRLAALSLYSSIENGKETMELLQVI